MINMLLVLQHVKEVFFQANTLRKSLVVLYGWVRCDAKEATGNSRVVICIKLNDFEYVASEPDMTAPRYICRVHNGSDLQAGQPHFHQSISVHVVQVCLFVSELRTVCNSFSVTSWVVRRRHVALDSTNGYCIGTIGWEDCHGQLLWVQ